MKISPTMLRFCACATLLAAAAQPAFAQGRWAGILDRPAAWYSTPEAEAVADNVLLYQTAEGGWPKNLDMTLPPSAQGPRDDGQTLAIFDNGGTTTQLRFLALMLAARDEPRWRASFLRGFDFVLAAQYPGGGWPMFFPLRPESYFSRITFNDDATVNILEVLRDGAQGKYPWLDAARREKALAAVARGVQCILRCQQRNTAGELTVWCAQHDEKTFAPASARTYELPSLSGQESVGLTRFLMSLDNPSPEVIAAIQGAVKWFRAAEIKGIRVENINAPTGRDRVVVADPNAPPLWARFYDLETSKPIFVGRDGVKKPALADIEQERRRGYAYYGNWPATLLATDYPAWEKKWIKSGPEIAVTWRAWEDNGDKPGVGWEIVERGEKISGTMFIIEPGRPDDFTTARRFPVEFVRVSDNVWSAAIDLAPDRRDKLEFRFENPSDSHTRKVIIRETNGVGVPQQFTFSRQD